MAPDHEQRTKEILLEELGEDVRVCTSAETLPEIREFERTSTAAANAYLMPVIERYLDALVDSLRDWGYDGDVLVTHSGGGVMSAQSASQVPARICHSGPAGGVVGGALVGKSAGVPSVITFDMGGTSADLSLVYEGRPSIASEWRVDWNIPILFPAVDLVAIGAGGGTIAWVDAGGSLRVGPQSAGADPGPACIDQGNEEPTITDAHLFLGRLDPAAYLGGDVEIHPELAEQAIDRLAGQLGLCRGRDRQRHPAHRQREHDPGDPPDLGRARLGPARVRARGRRRRRPAARRRRSPSDLGMPTRDRPADARRDLGPGHPPGRPAPRPPALGAQADGPARTRRARGRLRRASSPRPAPCSSARRRAATSASSCHSTSATTARRRT